MRAFPSNPAGEKSKRVKKQPSFGGGWRSLLGEEAEESSDLEQHLGEGLSPASCTERNAAQRPLVPVTPTGTTRDLRSVLRDPKAATGESPGGGGEAC